MKFCVHMLHHMLLPLVMVSSSSTITPAHNRGRVVTDFLAGEAIERMVWPANSPDLNPIEHLWDQLKRSVYRRIAEYNTLADLAQLLKEEWMAIPQRRVSRLVNTMRRRCLQVIEKRGGYTHF